MDEFDAILNLEDEWEREGQQQGIEDGRRAGVQSLLSFLFWSTNWSSRQPAVLTRLHNS